MITRTVAEIETATNERVGSFAIKNVLPTRKLKQVDPFLLIHHMGPHSVAKGEAGRIPPHPHAGFEVVTYLLDGSFFHRDSQGHNQVGKAGDINWMTSGRGVVHSEGPAEELINEGGKVQLLQVWINLPSGKKKLEPGFRHFDSSVFPVTNKGNTWIKTLIGTFDGQSSPIATQTPMFWHHLKIKEGEWFQLPVEKSFSAALYVLDGKIKVLNQEAKAGQLLQFHDDGDQLVFQAIAESDLIVFGGEPIREKVVSYGPFVMNSLEEVQQAIDDYENGRMGELDY